MESKFDAIGAADVVTRLFLHLRNQTPYALGPINRHPAMRGV